MVSFEIFVKAMPPSLSELKVLPSFCFAFKILDNVAASNIHFDVILSAICYQGVNCFQMDEMCLKIGQNEAKKAHHEIASEVWIISGLFV